MMKPAICTCWLLLLHKLFAIRMRSLIHFSKPSKTLPIPPLRNYATRFFGNAGKNASHCARLLKRFKPMFLSRWCRLTRIVASEKLITDEKIAKIKAVLLNFHASRPMVESRMSEMLAETDSSSDDSEFYNVLQQKSLTLQKRTADIIRLLQVDEKTVNKDLFDALQHFQINDGHPRRTRSAQVFVGKRTKCH